MKKQLLLLIITLASLNGISQYAIGTFSFTNSGGSGVKNQWTNSFNWMQTLNGTTFVSTGIAPTTAADNVIINLDNIDAIGTTIANVNSANRLVVDGSFSCGSFSVVGTAVNKGIRLGYNVSFNVYGNFDLGSGVPKCELDGLSYGGGGASINFAGNAASPYYIKTNNAILDIAYVYFNGNYELLDNYYQFPVLPSGCCDQLWNGVGLYITSTGKLKTNGNNLSAYVISNSGANSAFDISNSILNCRIFNSVATSLSNGTESLYLSDTLRNCTMSGISFRGTLFAKNVSAYTGKQASLWTQVVGITCQKFQTNTSINLQPPNAVFQAVTADTFKVTDKAIINIYGNNTFTTVITPGTCDKVVVFSVTGIANQVSMTVMGPNAVNYTSWLGINILGTGNIIATNSNDLGNNSGNITINALVPRVLAWCGSVDNNWENAANWRLLSGGPCGECPPTIADSVVFDPIYLSLPAMSQTVEIKSSAYCNGIHFNYPNSSPLVMKGGGNLFDAGGFWIGYPTGLTAVPSQTGTDFSAFIGDIVMYTTKKMVMIATQNVPMNSLGGTSGAYFGGIIFKGGGQWFFKDDFTTLGALRLLNGHIKCSKRTLNFISAFISPETGKITKLSLDTSLFIIKGDRGQFTVTHNTKVFVIGDKSTVLFNASASGGSWAQYPALGVSYGTRDTNNLRSINFWNMKFTTNIPLASLGAYQNGSEFYIHKLTLPPTFLMDASTPSVLNGYYPYVEIDSLNIADCNKLTLGNYTAPNSEAIKINQAIVTSTACGVYNNVFSDDANIPAEILVPSNFGTTKVLVQNVIINNGTGTLTATNSIAQGNTAGWIIPPSSGINFYWNGEGSNTNWDNPRNWNVNALPSSLNNDDGGNNPSNCVPGPLDSVFFSDFAFPITNKVTLKKACYAKTITWNLTSATNSVVWNDTTGATLHIYESLIMNAVPNLTYLVNTYFWGTSANNVIQSSGRVFSSGTLLFEGSGTYKLLDDLSSLYTIYVNLGTFNTNRKNVTLGNAFFSYKPTVRVLDIRGSKIDCGGYYPYDFAGGYGTWHYNSTNSTLLADSSEVRINGFSNGWAGVQSTMRNAGTNAANYNKVTFYSTPTAALGGYLSSMSDNLFSFNKVEFQVVNTGIYGSNRIDTLLYTPMSVNYLEAGKTQSVDSLRAISNNCQSLVLKSTTNGSYADICDFGSFKKLTTTFGDIIDIRSNTCAGFGANNETYNGGVTNSPGWIVSPNSLHFGFPAPSFTTACDNGPVNLNANGFYAGATSTYTWSTGSNASNINVKNPGTYSLTVTYKPGCAISDSVKVNFYPLQAIHSETAAICNAEANGLAYFSLTTDSTSSHTYQYTLQSSIPSTSITYSNSPSINYNGLAAGVYTLILVDTTTSLSACRYTQTLTISEPNALLTNASVSSSVACFGNATGALSSNPTGGNGGYMYSWTDGITTYTTQNVNTIPSNVYTLTVTDSKTCTVTNTLNVTQPFSIISSTVGATSDVLCFGGATGAATVSASGGTGAITYTWLPSGGNNSIATGLTFNTYTVNMLDANNCPTSQTLSINQPTSAITATGTQTNVLCNGQNNGVAEVVPIGGTGAYTYSWSTGTSTLQTSNNLTATNYTATVADANGCVTTQSFAITEPPVLVPSITATTQANCSVANGSATYTANGGVTAYTYSWTTSTGNYTTTAITTNSLPAGANQLTVIDANGCSTATLVNITNPNAPTITPTQTNVLCYGNNTGAAEATVTGGTSSYTYSWSPSTVTSTTNTANGITSGTYILTVTDAANCVVAQAYTINQPTAALTASTVSTNSVLCFGGNGVATTTVNGGTPSYTINWQNNASITTSATYTAGTYTMSVTDANGCATTTQTFTIAQPTVALSATGTQTDVLCNGQSNAIAEVTATGGTNPYAYIWSSGTSTLQTSSNLSATNYTATVTDANGCATTQTFTITEPTALAVSITSISPAGCGLSNGSATYTATGGTTAYTYSWVTSGGSYTINTTTTNSLSAGINNLTVIDANGCTTNTTVNIANLNAPSVVTTATNINCFGANTGAISASVTGTSVYTYTWSNGSFATGITNVVAGVYTVTVQDANSCMTVQTATITQPSSAVSLLISNLSGVNCFGASTGSASAIATGGMPSYTYTWNPGGANNTTLNNVPAGNYTISATDTKGCVTSSVVIITNASSSALNVSLSSLEQATCEQQNGSITASVTGGTPVYLYAWNTGTSNNQTLNNVGAGTYTLIVSDVYNCKDTLTVTLDCKTDLFIPQLFSPNSDGKNDKFEIKGISNYPNNNIQIFNRWGSLVFSKNKYNNDWDGKANVGDAFGKSMLPAGTYYVVLEFGDGTTKPYHGYVQMEY